MYAEIATLANDGTFRSVSLSDGTALNYVSLSYFNTTNSFKGVLILNNITQVAISFTLSDATDFNKIAIKYKQNNFSLFVNGTKVGVDVSGNTFPINTLNKLSFSRGDGAVKFFGNTKGLKVYPKALADVQLQDLTTL